MNEHLARLAMLRDREKDLVESADKVSDHISDIMLYILELAAIRTEIIIRSRILEKGRDE